MPGVRFPHDGTYVASIAQRADPHAHLPKLRLHFERAMTDCEKPSRAFRLGGAEGKTMMSAGRTAPRLAERVLGPHHGLSVQRPAPQHGRRQGAHLRSDAAKRMTKPLSRPRLRSSRAAGARRRAQGQLGRRNSATARPAATECPVRFANPRGRAARRSVTCFVRFKSSSRWRSPNRSEKPRIRELELGARTRSAAWFDDVFVDAWRREDESA